jgi:DNA-binding IclR family transcriptional regulator
MTEGVRALERSLDLLEALADGPRTLLQLSHATRISKTTAFRLLATLTARGLVIKDPARGSYGLGPGLLRATQGPLSGFMAIATLGQASLRSLSDETGETAALHLRHGHERLCIAEVPSPQSIRYSSVAGSRAPITNGSIGVVLLAFAPEASRDRILASLQSAEPPLDAPAMQARLIEARARGWAISIGERVPGATAISVPVTARGQLLALSVLGPATRLPSRQLQSFLPTIRRHAEQLTRVLDAPGTGSLEAVS